MTLFKKKVEKNGKEYIDLYLTWMFEDKVYKVRVNPTFKKDYKFLVSQAVDVED